MTDKTSTPCAKQVKVVDMVLTMLLLQTIEYSSVGLKLDPVIPTYLNKHLQLRHKIPLWAFPHTSWSQLMQVTSSQPKSVKTGQTKYKQVWFWEQPRAFAVGNNRQKGWAAKGWLQIWDRACLLLKYCLHKILNKLTNPILFNTNRTIIFWWPYFGSRPS